MDSEMIEYQPKIELPENVPALSSYFGTSASVPPDDFIVSRRRDGSVASYYASLQWDLTAYASDGRTHVLNFDSWRKTTGLLTDAHRRIIADMRRLMYILIWIREGNLLSVSALKNKFVMIRALARFAEKNTCGVIEILCQERLLKKYLAPKKNSTIQELSNLVGVMLELGEHATGIPVLSGKSLKELHAKRYAHQKSWKQIPPLSTRLYSNLIAYLHQELSDFELVAKQYLKLVEDLAQYTELPANKTARLVRKSAKESLEDSEKRKSTFPEVVAQYGLAEYFLKKNLQQTQVGLVKGLTEAQFLCKLTIHTFSGIRDGEADTLPFYCLDEVIYNDITHFQLLGKTTKHNNGRIKRVCWVTSKEGANAVRIAQHIARTLYKVLKDAPKRSNARLNDYPLFVSTGYLPYHSATPKSQTQKYAPGALNIHWERKHVLSRCKGLTITEEDISELSQIDPFRAWASEANFQIGSNWRVSARQLRRSLAIYASASGLVSLPTLRRQLKHITEEMSRYYAKGSIYAKNIIANDPDHFGKEYQDSQPESQALSYIRNVLLSDERLFGAHGTWLERNQRDKGLVLTVDDRTQTMKRFEKGEICYRETSLGGCTTVTPCDKMAMRSFTDCIRCSSPVIQVSKLRRAVKAQKALVDTLDPDTIEWRTEYADFQILKDALTNFESQSAKSPSRNVKRTR